VSIARDSRRGAADETNGEEGAMETMEINKAVAAVLVAGIAFMVCGLVGNGLVHPKRLDKPAIAFALPAAAPAAEPPIAALLASAAARGPMRR
jgi:hypothetical protein